MHSQTDDIFRTSYITANILDTVSRPVLTLMYITGLENTGLGYDGDIKK